MPTIEELRARFATYDDYELGEFAGFLPQLTLEAQAAFFGECGRRGLSVVRQRGDVRQAEVSAPKWYAGSLTVFQAWVAVVTCGFVGGYITVGAPPTGRAVLLLVFVVLNATGVVLVARRSSKARKYWLIYLGVIFGFVMVAPMFLARYSGALIVDLVHVGAWIVYWVGSRRVAGELGLRWAGRMAQGRCGRAAERDSVMNCATRPAK